MFAIVSGGRCEDGLSRKGFLLIRLFDVKSLELQSFQMMLRRANYYGKLFSSDGGLACFVATTKKMVTTPLLIVVVNPLTKEWKLLPALSNLVKGHPAMLRLVMDRVTKRYKVVVVWKEQHAGANILGMVYDSTTEDWSNTLGMSDLVFGCHFRWIHSREGLKAEQVGPCAYYCPQSLLVQLGQHVNPPLASRKGYALVNDHLFVLHERTSHNVLRAGDGRGFQKMSQFTILEYEGQMNSLPWGFFRVHDCEAAFRDFPGEFDLVLHACSGFLMVTKTNNVVFGPFKVVRTWLYDLSTCRWQELPGLPEGKDDDLETRPADEMCELQWDAVP